jgi:uncharacterized protein YbjT (DUF2867 family)
VERGHDLKGRTTMTILVVGATGQLGTAATLLAKERGRDVRAFVRPSSSFQPLQAAGIELAFGDLRDPDSVQRACHGVDAVISTATTSFPRGRASRFADDERRGYRHLIEACEAEGVGQLVFMSNYGPFLSPYLERVPSLRLKRDIELALADSKVPHTILRGAPFMDDYFALIGTDIPLRGARNATLERPFWFSRNYVRGMASLVEKRGVAMVPGGVHARHAFITIDDVAAFLVSAVGHDAAIDATHMIGGPENLSWEEVAGLYGRLLNRPVRAIPSAAIANRLGATLLRRVAPAVANQMGLLWIVCENENTLDDPHEVADLFGVRLTTAEEFLREKLGLPKRPVLRTDARAGNLVPAGE